MTADLTAVPDAPAPMLDLRRYLLANGVPRETVTAASAAFGAWLEQLGEGNALHALLLTAEALEVSHDKAAELEAANERLALMADDAHRRAVEANTRAAADEGRIEAVEQQIRLAMLAGNPLAYSLRAALSGGVV